MRACLRNPDAADEVSDSPLFSYADLTPELAAAKHVAAESARRPAEVVRIAMDTRYVKRYQGYLLQFAPQPSHDATFPSYLIVTREGHKPPVVEHSGVVDLPAFGASEDAAEAAIVAGMGWVQEKIGSVRRLGCARPSPKA